MESQREYNGRVYFSIEDSDSFRQQTIATLKSYEVHLQSMSKTFDTIKKEQVFLNEGLSRKVDSNEVVQIH